MYYKPVNPRGEGLYDIISTVTTVPSTVSLGMAGVWEGNTLCLPSFSVGGGRRANRNSHHCEAILLDRIRTLRRGCSYCFRGHWTFLKSQDAIPVAHHSVAVWSSAQLRVIEDNLIPQNIDCSFTGQVFGRFIVHLEDLITREKLAMRGASCYMENKESVLRPGGPRSHVSHCHSWMAVWIPWALSHMDLSFPICKP
jgi:hypothetical protein